MWQLVVEDWCTLSVEVHFLKSCHLENGFSISISKQEELQTSFESMNCLSITQACEWNLRPTKQSHILCFVSYGKGLGQPKLQGLAVY